MNFSIVAIKTEQGVRAVAFAGYLSISFKKTNFFFFSILPFIIFGFCWKVVALRSICVKECESN